MMNILITEVHTVVTVKVGRVALDDVVEDPAQTEAIVKSKKEVAHMTKTQVMFVEGVENEI